MKRILNILILIKLSTIYSFKLFGMTRSPSPVNTTLPASLQMADANKRPSDTDANAKNCRQLCGTRRVRRCLMMNVFICCRGVAPAAAG